MRASSSGWKRESLLEVSRGGLMRDGDWVESKDQDPAGTIRLTQLADVGVGQFRDRSNRWMRPDQAGRLRCTFIEPADVLIARMPDPIGRACLAPQTIGEAVTAVDVSILRIRRPDIDPRYVMWAINSPQFNQSVMSKQSGTTRKRISRKNLEALSIPVPSLREQRRIVEILEEHLSHLDAAEKSLDDALMRARSMETQTLSAIPGFRHAPQVPTRALLAEPLINGRSVPTADSGFPVLRLTALQDGIVDLAERKVGRWGATDAQRFLVERDDIFVARGNGSLKLVGSAALVVGAPDSVAFPDTMIRLRCDSKLILSEYLTLAWNSPVVRQQIERAARTTAGIYKINQKDLGAVVVPCPTLDEQLKIVAQASESRQVLRRLRLAIESAERRSGALRRSLLAAALSGRLTGCRSDNNVLEETANA